MRTKLYFVAALAATLLASCADDKFVGDNSPNVVQNESAENAINFGGGFKAVTRADDYVGADAAEKLSNKFYVVAFNGDGSTMNQTFDNYLVEWTINTAGTTESNTSDWEYVDKTAPDWSGIHGNKQTIKYWDYSNAQYDFIAWSPGTASVVTTTPSTGQVQITKPSAGSYAPSYAIAGERDDLAKVFIADMVTAYKADQTPAQPKFQQEVTFKFRNLATKVRMALYETVPGYSVKDVKFYTDNSTTLVTGTSVTNATLFTTGTADKDHFYTKGTYTVTFPNIGSSKLNNSDYNKAHVAFTADTKLTTENFGALQLVDKEFNEVAKGSGSPAAPGYLGRTLSTASYAGAASPYYKTMLPNEDGTVLELRIDYTLLATDGSGEEIKIHGAKAFVPAIYAKWMPNYAYTYIFKISDNTNGWTSTVDDTDPAGLYPITFDAIVIDSEEHKQSTITTVATPSITTYQKGHDVSQNEYLAATGDIYIQVMTDGTLATNLQTDGISKLYTLTGLTNPTEADVMDALNIQADNDATSITGRNGLVLTNFSGILNNITFIPGVDGNNITVVAGTAAKFTPSAGTYAYVYYTGTDNTDSDIYSAVTLTTDDAPTDWSGNYWNNPNGVGSAETAYVKNKTYYRHYTNLNKVYGVKVIKVQ